MEGRPPQTHPMEALEFARSDGETSLGPSHHAVIERGTDGPPAEPILRGPEEVPQEGPMTDDEITQAAEAVAEPQTSEALAAALAEAGPMPNEVPPLPDAAIDADEEALLEERLAQLREQREEREAAAAEPVRVPVPEAIDLSALSREQLEALAGLAVRELLDQQNRLTDLEGWARGLSIHLTRASGMELPPELDLYR